LSALGEYIDWFLEVCLDQVAFMTGLFELDTFLQRVAGYVALRGFKPAAFQLLEQVIVRGKAARGDVPRITGFKERTARALLAELLTDGILASDTPKGPVFLQVTLKSSELLFPSLFPAA